MFSSTRQVSVFNLRGEEVDDPDLYPILSPDSIEHAKSSGGNRSNADYSQSAVFGIPSPPSTPTSSTPQPSHTIELTKGPTTVQKNPPNDHAARGSLKAVGLDPTYIPPVQFPSKPIACFYVRPIETEQQSHGYYRAVYLSERTARALANSIAEKFSIDPKRVVHIMYVNAQGLRVKIDDDVVCQVPEGQDMIMEVNQVSGWDDSQENMLEPPLEIQLYF
ncbi:unnamed protein product [Penicillium salamii]|uniref:GRHL1/CP2 C-terminal domain-containing protein n=1 Tax=Penicillium salamii TaxID=1612424 RepID=A0A9W4NM17_9EURO|nr:unnamed protein product [Penicillium salamii]